MKTVPSLYDVAELAGLSHMTVSNVLNRPDRQHLVAPQTAERVRTAAKKLGYQRNRVAASLARGKTQTLGVVIASLRGSFHATVLQGIEKKCAAHGYRVMLLFATDSEPGTTQVRKLLGDCVAGLIVVGDCALSDISHWSDAAARQHTPVVLVDMLLSDKRVDGVISDDRHGALAATEHLVSLGHRRIAHLAGNLSLPTNINRREGYRAALQKAGLVPEEIVTEDGRYGSGAFRQAVTKLLEPSTRPTAVLAASDFHAAVALQVALQHGLRVPGDLAVVGYGDTETGWAMDMTSVSQNAEQMGALSVERLFARLSNPSLVPEDLIVPTRLVVRRSCGAPSDAGSFPSTPLALS